MTVGKPLRTMQLLEVLTVTGSRGVHANTTAAQDGVQSTWQELLRHWAAYSREPEETSAMELKELILRTNQWIERTLAPVERRRLQAYLRQRAYRERVAPEVIQVPMPREFYDKLTEGLSRAHRKTYLMRLLTWAAEQPQAREAVLREMGLSAATEAANATSPDTLSDSA